MQQFKSISFSFSNNNNFNTYSHAEYFLPLQVRTPSVYKKLQNAKKNISYVCNLLEG